MPSISDKLDAYAKSPLTSRIFHHCMSKLCSTPVLFVSQVSNRRPHGCRSIDHFSVSYLVICSQEAYADVSQFEPKFINDPLFGEGIFTRKAFPVNQPKLACLIYIKSWSHSTCVLTFLTWEVRHFYFNDFTILHEMEHLRFIASVLRLRILLFFAILCFGQIKTLLLYSSRKMVVVFISEHSWCPKIWSQLSPSLQRTFLTSPDLTRGALFGFENSPAMQNISIKVLVASFLNMLPPWHDLTWMARYFGAMHVQRSSYGIKNGGLRNLVNGFTKGL